MTEEDITDTDDTQAEDAVKARLRKILEHVPTEGSLREITEQEATQKREFCTDIWLNKHELHTADTFECLRAVIADGIWSHEVRS